MLLVNCTQHQAARISERDSLIQQISSRHNIKGYEHAPLERDKILEFKSRLADMKQRSNRDTENIEVKNQQCNKRENMTHCAAVRYSRGK
jgi:DNA repair protein RAD50